MLGGVLHQGIFPVRLPLREAPVTLSATGGTLALDGAGAYVLTTAVMDELGKEYTATLPIEVYVAASPRRRVNPPRGNIFLDLRQSMKEVDLPLASNSGMAVKFSSLVSETLLTMR